MLPTTSKVAMLHAIQPPATRPFVIDGARTIGTVAAITAWNFPVITLLRTIMPALVAGNPVVLKPAIKTVSVKE